MDERLLVTCTRGLLENWTGPVHGLVQMGVPARAVCTGDFDDRGRVYLWTDGGDASVRPDEVSLDLSRAECRDRVVRVLASRVPGCNRVGEPHVVQLPRGMSRLYFGAHGVALSVQWSSDPALSDWHVPALAALDPNDDTRLADASRLVDALALAAVWREVSR